MVKYPDIAEMGRLSSEDYSTITSMEQVSRREKSRFERGYPANGTPEWWALRHRIEEILHKQQRDLRKAYPLAQDRDEHRSRHEHELATTARWVSLGNEDAQADYERIDPNTGHHELMSMPLYDRIGNDIDLPKVETRNRRLRP